MSEISWICDLKCDRNYFPVTEISFLGYEVNYISILKMEIFFFNRDFFLWSCFPSTGVLSYNRKFQGTFFPATNKHLFTGNCVLMTLPVSDIQLKCFYCTRLFQSKNIFIFSLKGLSYKNNDTHYVYGISSQGGILSFCIMHSWNGHTIVCWLMSNKQ